MTDYLLAAIVVELLLIFWMIYFVLRTLGEIERYILHRLSLMDASIEHFKTQKMLLWTVIGKLQKKMDAFTSPGKGDWKLTNIGEDDDA